jgi:hypothetical protein
MSLLFLVSRAASDSDSDSKYVCPTKDTGGPAIVPFIGTLTYHQFSIILSGSCALLSTLMISVLIATHASNYLNRVQQRQVIRIALLITWVALFSFLIVWLEGVGEYLVESLDFGRAIALASFLLLMCDFVLSHRGGFDDLFGQGAESRDAFKGKSPTMLKVRAWSFFYISPTNLCSSAIGTASYNSSPRLSSFGSRPPSHSQSVPTANSPTAFISRTSGFLSGKSSSATIAILSCLRFYKQHKAKLQQHKILLKLFTFKSIIGLNVIQTVSRNTFQTYVPSNLNIVSSSLYPFSPGTTSSNLPNTFPTMTSTPDSPHSFSLARCPSSLPSCSSLSRRCLTKRLAQPQVLSLPLWTRSTLATWCHRMYADR